LKRSLYTYWESSATPFIDAAVPRRKILCSANISKIPLRQRRGICCSAKGAKYAAALPIPDAKSGLTLKTSNKKNPCVLLLQIHCSQQSQRSSRQI